jgi:CheY-like chemotaxis protein
MHNLSFGSRGVDVLALQKFFIGIGLLATENATGYFGKFTQAAVQSYQRSRNIVSSGTPATTGYGALGPRTRAALAQCKWIQIVRLLRRSMVGLTNDRVPAFYSPRRCASTPHDLGTGYPMQNLPLSGTALLVVEDEPLVALDLRQTLEGAGAYVFAVTQLPHALQLAGHPDISAAVLDYRLADGDCAPICALLSQRGIPFVFYSGYDDVREIWPDATHVQKPAAAQRVVEAVSGALRNSTIASTARAA